MEEQVQRPWGGSIPGMFKEQDGGQLFGVQGVRVRMVDEGGQKGNERRVADK